MSRYLIDGMRKDAEEGKRVLYCSSTGRDARATFEQMAAEAAPEVKVYRANGSESLTWPNGGRITFHFAGRGLRGMEADVTVVRGWNDLHEASRQDAVLTTNGLGGELIRI